MTPYPSLTAPDALTDRLLIAGTKKPLSLVTRRAVMETLDLIAYAVGVALAQLRSSADPVMAVDALASRPAARLS